MGCQKQKEKRQAHNTEKKRVVKVDPLGQKRSHIPGITYNGYFLHIYRVIFIMQVVMRHRTLYRVRAGTAKKRAIHPKVVSREPHQIRTRKIGSTDPDSALLYMRNKKSRKTILIVL